MNIFGKCYMNLMWSLAVGNYVTLEELLNYFGFQFTHFQNRNKNSYHETRDVEKK